MIYKNNSQLGSISNFDIYDLKLIVWNQFLF